MRKLELAAVALAFLAIVGLPTAAFGYQSFLRARPDREFTLVGKGGQWSQEELRVRQGERVRLRLTSGDSLHGFRLRGYGIETDRVYPGKVKVIDFVADKPGTFPFTCTVICGVNHGEMEGELIVEGQEQPSVSRQQAKGGDRP